MNTPRIVSINISKDKGTIKRAVDSIAVDLNGLVGDAHAGFWHRQVTLLSKERIEFFAKEAKRKINFGEFAENITTENIDLSSVCVFDRFIIGDVELEVTQIGKKCHGSACAIFKEVGNCIMPKEGIFCKVIQPGKIHVGDEIQHIKKSLNIQIITLSDRASQGIYEDKSGIWLKEEVEKFFQHPPFRIKTHYNLISDNADELTKLLNFCLDNSFEMVITTGGTGIGPKDITPDVVKPLFEKELNGIMDFIRFKYGQEIPAALVSRAVAGLSKNTLIFTLPGSLKAVKEYFAEISKNFNHLIYMKHGIDNH